jgi:hypothetical protein
VEQLVRPLLVLLVLLVVPPLLLLLVLLVLLVVVVVLLLVLLLRSLMEILVLPRAFILLLHCKFSQIIRPLS